MEHASKKLLVPEMRGEKALEVHFLTGKKYWYQTVFCIYSLQNVTGLPWIYHVYDDGSFDHELILQIQSQVPTAKVHTIAEIEERLRTAIPKKDFPFLWQKRKVYPHIKKLTDVHAGTEGWKLVLDSDMLFQKRPIQILDWLKTSRTPFFILDTDTYYGYSLTLLEGLLGFPIRLQINVGAIGMKSEDIQWPTLQNWAMELENQEGSSYFLEQALTAMLLGQEMAIVGPANEYIVNPSKEQVEKQEGILHHYVDLSKEWYYKKAWRQFL